MNSLSVGAIIGFTVMVGLLVGMTIQVLRDIRDRKRRDEYRRLFVERGFEVKLNSGGEPETKKKENDHG